MTQLSPARSASNSASRAPRAKALPWLGNAVPITFGPLEFLTRMARQYGDVVDLAVPQQRIYLFSHPDAVEQILVTERDKMVKDELTHELSYILGQGLLVSEGTHWRAQRRLVQPGFHRERVAGYVGSMVQHTERLLKGWRSGQTLDIHKEMLRVTLDIVCDTLFGTRIEAEAAQIEHALEVFMGRFSSWRSLVPTSLPLPMNLRTKRAIEDLNQIVYALIEGRRSASAGDDLLFQLTHLPEELGSQTKQPSSHSKPPTASMSAEHLRDEVVTLMLAGHETTAIALSFTFYLLSRNAEAQNRLLSEVKNVLAGRQITAEDIPQLPYTEAVVKESMRLYPPAWTIGREAVVDCVIHGHQVERGTQLLASQWVIQKDARWYPEPLRFKPERWLGDAARLIPKHAYFPFGGGARVCIGNHFAMLEAITVLVTVLQRFQLTPISTGAPKLFPSITLRPVDGMKMRCRAA